VRASQLPHPEAAALLAQLLVRLLPQQPSSSSGSQQHPQQEESGMEGSRSEPPAPAALSTEAAVFGAQALALRRCAHLGCSNLSGDDFGLRHPSKQCTGCRTVRYCGTACQGADWPAHRRACRARKAVADLAT
jgi:hypothetical protein